MNRAFPHSGPHLVCPACRARVGRDGEFYSCTGCGRRFPILFGVPDFRLRPDRYLSLEAEREKAGRLFEASKRLKFPDLLAFYYSVTDDVTAERAKAYASYVQNGPARAADDLATFGAVPSGATFLDAGCGAGGALVAARAKYLNVTGVDIALRWLVICRRRLDELGITADLVCADIEALPFEAGQFTHVMAADAIEHVYDQQATITALARQVAPAGLFWMSAINRWWPGPHPSTGRWAAGYRRPATGPHGYDPLRFVTNISARQARLMCEKAGLDVIRISPRRVVRTGAKGNATARDLAVAAYGALREMPLMGAALVKAGPAFEVLARARSQGGTTCG